MTWGGTARLAALLIVLLAVVWIAERRGARPPTDQQPALLAGAPDRVARIELDEPAGRLIVVRSAHGWTDGAGRPWRSDAPDDLLAALATLRPTLLDVPADDAIDEYGLGRGDASQLRVVDQASETLLVLDIGHRNPAWTGRYARRPDGGPLLLVGALLDWELDKLRESSPTQ